MRGNFFIVFDTLPQYLFLPREDVIFQDNTDYITTLFFKYTVNTADAKIMVTVDEHRDCQYCKEFQDFHDFQGYCFQGF